MLRALSAVLGATLPYDSLLELRAAMIEAVPHLEAVDQVVPADPAAVERLGTRGGDPSSAPFRSAVTEFYLTNPIARASAVMAECAALARARMAEAAE